MRILNLTQHPASPEQIKDGVLEPNDKDKIRELLTFNVIPDRQEIYTRAQALAEVAANHNVDAAMIGGALFLMGPLSQSLREKGITPLFAFTKRVVEETMRADGTIKKKAVFRHEGWVKAI